MKKNLISKRVKKTSGFKFLVVTLILMIALVLGVKLAGQNQENRSSAYYAETGGSTPIIGRTYWYGPTNSSSCKNMSGTCAYFNDSYSEGTYCVVNGATGYIKKGLCAGDNSTLCCSTRKPCYVNGNTYLDGTKFCNGTSRVYVCDNGNQVYRGLDCTSTGKVCSNGNCVLASTVGTGSGAEKCVAKGGACKKSSTGGTPVAGSACTINGKAGRFWVNLCGGQYLNGYMCCVPN